jgi:Ca2+/Na+ antiporter
MPIPTYLYEPQFRVTGRGPKEGSILEIILTVLALFLVMGLTGPLYRAVQYNNEQRIRKEDEKNSQVSTYSSFEQFVFLLFSFVLTVALFVAVFMAIRRRFFI